MADWGVVIVLITWAIWWPISKLLSAIAILLSPIWRVSNFVLLPFIHCWQTIFSVITYHFSVQWLDRIETLYVFLATAGLVGCITGTLLYLIFKFMASTLSIDKSIVPQNRTRGRTTAEYRSARREKKEEESVVFSPPGTPVVLQKVLGPRRRGLLSQAIIEEEDSDF